ncbi:MAG: ribose-5-phosphate isomerase [Nocardioidaceae bacterium]
MRLHIASDHAGFELKQHLVERLSGAGHEVVDHGASTYDSTDDYPTYCLHGASAVIRDPGSLGIVIGGSGNGEQISANKIAGVRAALIWNEETARLARQHNDANVGSVGARMHSIETATRLVEVFVSTPFSGDPRHARRIEMLHEYEESGELPPLP